MPDGCRWPGLRRRVETAASTRSLWALAISDKSNLRAETALCQGLASLPQPKTEGGSRRRTCVVKEASLGNKPPTESPTHFLLRKFGRDAGIRTRPVRRSAALIRRQIPEFSTEAHFIRPVVSGGFRRQNKPPSFHRGRGSLMPAFCTVCRSPDWVDRPVRGLQFRLLDHQVRHPAVDRRGRIGTGRDQHLRLYFSPAVDPDPVPT